VVFRPARLGLEQVLQYLRPDLARYSRNSKAWTLVTPEHPIPMPSHGTTPRSMARHRHRLSRHGSTRSTQQPRCFGPAELAQWEADGYAILRDAITPDQARAAESSFGARSRESPATRQPGTTASGKGSGHHGPAVAQDPALETGTPLTAGAQAFAQLWGTADLWSKVDRMTFNPPKRPQAVSAHRISTGTSASWPPIPFATQAFSI
jgi:hypothetical protein